MFPHAPRSRASRKRIFVALTVNGTDWRASEAPTSIGSRARLFGQGIRGIDAKSRYKTLKSAELVTGDSRPVPERLGREITREIERLAQVQAHIVEIERERDKASTPCVATEAQASPAPVLEGRRPGLIVHAHAGSLLSAVRQSATGGELYRDYAQCLRQRRRTPVPRHL